MFLCVWNKDRRLGGRSRQKESALLMLLVQNWRTSVTFSLSDPSEVRVPQLFSCLQWTRGTFQLAVCVSDHPQTIITILQRAQTVAGIIPAPHAIIITVAIEWIIRKVLCAEIISTVRKLGIHTRLTYSHNCTNYYEPSSCCISLELCAAPDLIMMTTVHLVMVIIRTIVVMMRVLFMGPSLPLCD